MPDVCWRLVSDYNLRYPLDPARTYNFDAFIESDTIPSIETENFILNRQQIPESRRLTITIDLHGSSTDQSNYINGLLRAYVKLRIKTRRRRKSDYLDYLRILDGLALEEKWNIIAKALGKKRSAYDKAVKNAKDLRKTGFFALSQLKTIHGKGNRTKQGQADGKVFFNTLQIDALSMRKAICGNNCISSNNVEIFIKPLTPPQKN